MKSLILAFLLSSCATVAPKLACQFKSEGSPQGPTYDEIGCAMDTDKFREDLISCYRASMNRNNADVRIDSNFFINQAGRAEDITIGPDYAEKPIGLCSAEAISKVQFPTNKATSRPHVHYPIKFFRKTEGLLD